MLLIDVGFAAVTTIPITRTVIIGIVANAVTFENKVGATAPLALPLDVRRIEAGALLAVAVLHFCFGKAAIAAVPVTSTVVVGVVTLAVSFPRVYLAFPRT